MKETQNIKVMGLKDAQLVAESFDDSNLKPNEAIIKNEISLISAGTELSRVYGIKKGVEYPVYPGYIAVGTILEKGSDLKDVNVGDKVMFNGAHQEYQRFTHNGLNLELILPLPKELSLEAGVLVYMASIALNGLYGTDIKLGDTAAVFGLGTLGLFTAKFLQFAGVNVIGLDTIASRCENAKKLGIETTLSCPADEQEKNIFEITNGRGVDIAIDVAGVSPAIETAINCTAFNGNVVLSGSPRAEYQGNITNILNRIHMRMLTVKGAYNDLCPFYEQNGSRYSVYRNLQYIIDCFKSSKLKAEDFISHSISPREPMVGYKGLMEDRENYRCVIFDWSKL